MWKGNLDFAQGKGNNRNLQDWNDRIVLTNKEVMFPDLQMYKSAVNKSCLIALIGSLTIASYI